MNPKNIKPKPPHNKMDTLVERLNKKIARMMGKKGKLPPQKKTSNLVFSIMVLVFSTLLWISTGFYYLGENQFGLVVQNGAVSRVVKGIKVGFTAPYPFGNIEVINASPSDLIDLNKMSLTSTNFSVLSRDLYTILVAAKFSYQIIDPKLAFQKSLQKQDNLDAYTAWQLQVALHNYFMHKENIDITRANLTITANEVKDDLNSVLAKSGVELVKLNIYSIHSIHSPQISAVPIKNISESQSVQREINTPTPINDKVSRIARQLLAEAVLYRQNLLLDTQVNINQFNQLLPQYRANHNVIVQQIYYDTLSMVPITQVNNYPLLNLPLSELLMQNKAILTKSEGMNVLPSSVNTACERHFNREVTRQRNIGLGSEK